MKTCLEKILFAATLGPALLLGGASADELDDAVVSYLNLREVIQDFQFTPDGVIRDYKEHVVFYGYHFKCKSSDPDTITSEDVVEHVKDIFGILSDVGVHPGNPTDVGLALHVRSIDCSKEPAPPELIVQNKELIFLSITVDHALEKRWARVMDLLLKEAPPDVFPLLQTLLPESD